MNIHASTIESLINGLFKLASFLIFSMRRHALQIFFVVVSIWIVSFDWGTIIFQSNIQSLYSPDKFFEELSTWSRANLGSINSSSLWRYTSTESLFAILRFIGLGPKNVVQVVLGFLFYTALRYSHKLFKFISVHGSSSDLVYLFPAFYFAFNLYTLNQISGDYTLVIPHLLLPLQLYLALKGIETHSKKLACAFIFVSMFVFGVNLVFNVIMFF